MICLKARAKNYLSAYVCKVVPGREMNGHHAYWNILDWYAVLVVTRIFTKYSGPYLRRKEAQLERNKRFVTCNSVVLPNLQQTNRIRLGSYARKCSKSSESNRIFSLQVKKKQNNLDFDS